MAAPYSQIKRKAEDAFEAMINDLKGTHIGTIPIHKVGRQDSPTRDRIEILADVAIPEVIDDTEYYTGNWYVDIAIGYVANINDDDLAAARDNVESELFDILMRNDIVAQLNAAGITDFTVFGGTVGAGEGQGWEPLGVHTLVNTASEVKEEFRGRLYCKPS